LEQTALDDTQERSKARDHGKCLDKKASRAKPLLVNIIT